MMSAAGCWGSEGWHTSRKAPHLDASLRVQGFLGVDPHVKLVILRYTTSEWFYRVLC
jgi:hypothetical protein